MKVNDKKIKIIFVIQSLGFGGREKVVIDIANGLNKDVFEVCVILFSCDRNEQLGFVAEGIVVHVLPFSYNQLGGMSALSFWLRGMPQYIRLLRKIQPDIIHTHLFFQHFLFAAIGIKFSFKKVKHFQTVHTYGLFYTKKGFINLIRLMSEKLAVYINRTNMIAISKTVYEITSRHFKKYAASIKCISNGVDNRKFDFHLRGMTEKGAFGLKEEDVIVTYVARMDEGKDHKTLLRAWQKVNLHINNAKLLLVGDGDLKDDLEHFVSQNNLSSSVIFLNSITSVNKILAITDVGVFTSLFEGLGIAVIEKMFMKVPVIAADIPVMRELIVQGKTGYLFPAKDYNALSKLLQTLLKNKDLRLSIGSNGYNSIQEYSLTNMICKHEDFYKQVIND